LRVDMEDFENNVTYARYRWVTWCFVTGKLHELKKLRNVFCFATSKTFVTTLFWKKQVCYFSIVHHFFPLLLIHTKNCKRLCQGSLKFSSHNKIIYLPKTATSRQNSLLSQMLYHYLK